MAAGRLVVILMRMGTPARELRAAGFTVVEMITVVAIIGLLAGMAIPQFSQARETSRATLMFSRMRTAASAFQMYAMDHAAYPPNAAPGMVPAGMAGYLGKFEWTQPTPLGGHWSWDLNRYGFHAAVSVTGHHGSPATMLQLDRRIDDGKLDSGLFRARPDGHSFVLD
jgi:prepilin-type N-terminal cleavage/methylation domain-containing protein